MDRAAKDLAEQLIDSFGEAAMHHPRPLIADLLEDHGLDRDSEDVDDFERHVRWLWEE
jgi:hypothetical protein